jgi:pyrimidine-nucleoside phosphorylase
MDMLSIIEARRDGREHTRDELAFLADAAAHNTVPDYQLSAWLMAAYLKPLNERETAALTLAMAHSGERIDLEGLPKPWVDKHSTGGVGDKTSIVVLPMLAACGLTIVKMSGRGLGITGGTVDKLESIPGFRMDLTPEEMKDQADLIGIAITGQSPDLAPADKALYALRDTTGTTESIPLIVSSILSKKIAGGADYLSLDVKAGSGAFMKTPEGAKDLAIWLKSIGEQCGLKVHTVITDMDQPLGGAVGNILEVKEALAVLFNQTLSAPVARFRDLCIELCGQTLHFVGKAESREDGNAKAHEALLSGAAHTKCVQWFEAQGVLKDVLDDPFGTLPEAPVALEFPAPLSGNIARLDAGTIGEAVIDLGGGRKKKDDKINPSVGIVVHKIVGDTVEEKEPIATVYAASQAAAESAIALLQEATSISNETVAKRSIVLSD